MNSLDRRILHPTFNRQDISQPSSSHSCSFLKGMSVTHGRTSVQHYHKTVPNEHTSPYRNGKLPSPLLQFPLLNLFPSLPSYAGHPLPAALDQWQSRLMQFAIAAKLKTSQQQQQPPKKKKNPTESPTPHPPLCWKQARISVGTFRRIERGI